MARQVSSRSNLSDDIDETNDGADGNGEEDDDDDASDVSEFSGLSGDDWKPTAGPMAWIQRQALLGKKFCGWEKI